ncbi:MAG: hypothetical protein E7294_11575 [Lachnospiraceae bacterium]|nr:hypothetical protein [Lachnospiraceae bacterium]
MGRFKGIKGMILLVIIAFLIVGYYYHLSNKTIPEKEEVQKETLTETQKVLVRDLETNYPQTPREVVKYFVEITKCLYNEELTEDDICQLGMKLREIYDDDLVANQTQSEYIEQLKNDVVTTHTKEQTLFNYSLASAVDVETYTMEDREWAKLHCIFGIRQKQLLYNSDTVFLLRKDENGHYKIYGWELVSKEQ